MENPLSVFVKVTALIVSFSMVLGSTTMMSDYEDESDMPSTSSDMDANSMGTNPSADVETTMPATAMVTMGGTVMAATAVTAGGVESTPTETDNTASVMADSDTKTMPIGQTNAAMDESTPSVDNIISTGSQAEVSGGSNTDQMLSTVGVTQDISAETDNNNATDNPATDPSIGGVLNCYECTGNYAVCGARRNESEDSASTCTANQKCKISYANSQYTRSCVDSCSVANSMPSCTAVTCEYCCETDKCNFIDYANTYVPQSNARKTTSSLLLLPVVFLVAVGTTL